MRLKRSTLVRFASTLALALTVAAPSTDASRELSDPLDLLGIQRLECRCSKTLEAGSDSWLWLFVSEPRIGAVDPDGPSHGRLRPGDVLVAVDGWLITTRAGGESFSRISPGEPVELTVRHAGIERRERIVPRLRDELDVEPELERRGTDLTIRLAELSRALAELARISPELSELGEFPELPEMDGLSELDGLSALGDLKIDTRPLGWFGIGLSFSGSMRQRSGSDEPPLWDFDGPPKIHSLDRDGPARRAGLERGDLLTHIDGLPLDGPRGERRFSEVRPGQTVTWTVRRNGASLTIPVTAEERPR